ncbi:c-type cytochrome [Taklimakanibacter lacteus]|uniref:c-type cytochrome n=1 Tax=Taklimakanibacter lacteus TaxID=2268456 RepID=UPI000E673A49
MRLSAAVFLALSLPTAAAQAVEPNYNYALHCTGCHTAEGVSPPLGRIPPLKGVVGHLVRSEDARLYFANVPGIVNSGLSADETAALLNWVVEVFGEKSTPESWTPFNGAEIKALRKAAPADIMAYRKHVQDELDAQGYSIGAYP